ncbi:hypothetical protein BC567DRAFT_214104 [Phyllosticta citribraziliensis]
MPKTLRPSGRMRQTQTTNLHRFIYFSGVLLANLPVPVCRAFCSSDDQEGSLRCRFDLDSRNRCRREQPSAFVA